MSVKPKPLRQQQQPNGGAQLRPLRSTTPATLTPVQDNALSKVEQQVASELGLHTTVIRAMFAKAAFAAEGARDLAVLAASREVEGFDHMQMLAAAPHDSAVQEAVDQAIAAWEEALHSALGEVFSTSVEGIRQLVQRSLYPAPPPAPAPKRGLWSRMRGKEE
jgi:hypothetical protein